MIKVNFSRLMVFLLSMATTGCTDSKALELLSFPSAQESWNIAKKGESQDERYCVISSGKNGLAVAVLKAPSDRKAVVQVRSTRLMKPGDKFRIIVNQHYYQVTADRFTTERSTALVNDLLTHERAYLKWRVNDMAGEGVGAVHNFVQLAGFKELYPLCQNYVSE